MRSILLIPRFLFIALVFVGALFGYVVRRVFAGRLSTLERERLRGDVLAGTLDRRGAPYDK